MIQGYLVNETRIPIQMLEASAEHHTRLCPRQVLGLRMGLLAGQRFGLRLPREDKRLIAIVETDGCTTDGIMAATGCSVGRRTMFIKDWGKVAATFIDRQTGEAIRILPTPESREAACTLLPDAESSWHAQLEGYQMLPDEELLIVMPVELNFCVESLISEPGHLAICARCHEEIRNQREVIIKDELLCRSCAGESYYAPTIKELRL